MVQLNLVGQETDTISKASAKQFIKGNLTPEKILDERANQACLCIDSISTFDNNANVHAQKIKKCIDKEVSSFQMMVRMSEIMQNETEKDATIELNTNPSSDTYKKYYYQLERKLVDDCEALKNVMSSNDKQSASSLSEIPEAILNYELGIDAINQHQDFKKALSYFEKAVKIDTTFSFAWDNIGVCHRKLGNFDKAIEAYERSIRIDPDGRTPYQNIAVTYVYKKEFKKAIEAYKKLKRFGENDPEIFYGIGSIYFNYLENYEKALINMCKAYVLYVEQNSPYRSDAEAIMNSIYRKMKENDQEKRFIEILDQHNIAH